MISSFQLKSGRAPGAAAQPIPASHVTVFVGPNNSGKSQVLREIEQFCRTGTRTTTAVVLDQIAFSGLPQVEASAAIVKLTQAPNPGESVQVGHQIIGSRGTRQQVAVANLEQFVVNPNANPQAFCSWFLTHCTLRLDGQSRIGLVNMQPAGDLQLAPQSSLQVLFRDDVKRQEVRRIVADAFNSYFVIDPTSSGHFRVRLSPRPPSTAIEERGIHAEAVQFHGNAQLIDQASDGVKAFTGIVVELVAGDPRVLLIDEPEAFLHPSLASTLGNEISRAAVSTDKRVFVATHSPNFVMGCIQSGTPVNIVRLTYRAGVATARILPSNDLLELMRKPLLRSTGVLSGLFYEFVVVTESDADRAFYQEINERLLRFQPEMGIPNCLFINGQNKQTVKTIIQPLRELGIPAVGVVDVDVVKDGGKVWTDLLVAASVPALEHGSLGQLRGAVRSAMDNTNKDMKRDGGVDILQGTDKEAALNLFEHLAEYGIFVVPGGELESWLKPLGATGHSPNWLIDIFQKMGDDPASSQYVKPSSGDVWNFLGSIRAWLTNANRKGIPA